MPMETRTHQTRGGGSLFQRVSETFEVEKDDNNTRLDDRRKLMARHCASGYVSINRQEDTDRVRMKNNGFAIRKNDGMGMGRARFMCWTETQLMVSKARIE